MAFDPRVEGVDYQVIERYVTLGVAAVLVAPANPSRIVLLFGQGNVAGSLTVDTRQTVVSAVGIPFPTTGPLILKFEDIGPMVGFAWWCFASGGAGTLTVKELIYRPVG